LDTRPAFSVYYNVHLAGDRCAQLTPTTRMG
jgi:hypothetical protein